MRRYYREPLLPESLSSQEIEANREGKLEKETAALLYDYDDSSDEEEGLNYRKVSRSKIETIKEGLQNFKFRKEIRIKVITKKLLETHNQSLKEELDRLEEEKLELENALFETKEILSNNPAYVMEIEGRYLIYKHLPEYRQRKFETFSKVDLKIESAVKYNCMLISVLLDKSIITAEQARKWISDQNTISSLKKFNVDDLSFCMAQMKIGDSTFFTEENKFCFLRRFLRQTNREVTDNILSQEVSNFVLSLGATKQVTEVELKSLAQIFTSKLPIVKRNTLSRTRVNPDIESVEDFYAEELLRYKSLIRSSREINGQDFDIVQTLVFDASEDLVSQKKQSISKDKGREDDKNHFSHRGTVEEEVLNLGNYENVLSKLKTFGLTDKSLAIIIREVFCRGTKSVFNEYEFKGKKLVVFLSQEKKQIIIDTVELLFGTEGFRSPSSIVETNMMLDLIIKDPTNWSFEKAFVGKFIPGTQAGNGGALSYTMKTKQGHFGGIPCGRNLSKKFDTVFGDCYLKIHKYGGPFKVKEDDFEEYKGRKKEIADSWIKTCFPTGSKDLGSAIQQMSQKWYSRNRPPL